MLLKVALSIFLWSALTGLSSAALAEEEAEQNEVRYVDLTPSLVTNFSSMGRLKFLRAEISLRVDSQEAMRSVSYHLPALRHVLIMLLSKQTDEALSSAEGKEQLRQEALVAVQEVMEHEEGQKYIKDILFSSLYVQH